MTEQSFEDKFNMFIKVWCFKNYPHLIDTDENDGENLREFVRLNYIRKQKVIEIIERVREHIVSIDKGKYIEDIDYIGTGALDELEKELELK